MNDYVKKAAGIGIVILLALSIIGPTVDAQVLSDSPMPFHAPFNLKPNFAQFLSSTLVLKGNSAGLSVIDIEKNQTVQTALEDIAITTMMANPHKAGQVAVATNTGDAFLCNYSNGNLSVAKLDCISKSDLTVVKTIQFHDVKDDQMLFADEKQIALCKIDGDNVSVERYASLGTNADAIVFTFPDNLSTDWFLISTTQGGRYRGNWATGEVINVPESILEYGYQVRKHGISYLARGENEEYLNISFITAHPTFIIRHPSQSNTFFAATIGIAPLKITVQANNHYTVDYLSENKFLTFSVDVDRSNPRNLLFSTSSSVQFSDDGGSNWKVLEK